MAVLAGTWTKYRWLRKLMLTAPRRSPLETQWKQGERKLAAGLKGVTAMGSLRT